MLSWVAKRVKIKPPKSFPFRIAIELNVKFTIRVFINIYLIIKCNIREVLQSLSPNLHVRNGPKRTTVYLLAVTQFVAV